MAQSNSILQLYDLFNACASGESTVEEVSDSIVQYAQGETAPDSHVFSDLLLDTLFLYYSGVVTDEQDLIDQRRDRLGSLVANLIASSCIFEADACDRLEFPILQAARLIDDSKVYEKRQVKINTNRLYRQQKFNLLREENEGYSKLIVEFEGFLKTTPNESSDAHASQLLSNIQSIIGYFDLDPNRVLDILFELSAASLVYHWKFLILFFSSSPWFTSNGQEQEPGSSSAAAQIFGFKFQQMRQSDDDAQSLIMLAALLTKQGLISLSDLWPHLSPSDNVFGDGRSAYQNRILDEVDKAKGRNALALAGGLDDEPASVTTTKDVKSAPTELPRKDNDQKLQMVEALLAIGALPDVTFLLSEFPFLLNANGTLADSYNVLLEAMIDPLWQSLRVHQHYSPETVDNLYQPKKIPEELKYRDSQLILPKPRRVRYVLSPRLKANAYFEERFFYTQVASLLPLVNNSVEFEAFATSYLRLAGVQIFRNVKLLTKLARIGCVFMRDTNDRNATQQTWTAIIRQSLLPALSLIDANPAIVNDVHNLVREFSTEDRYSLYGEWFSESYRKVPELKVQFVKTEKETKSLLRRISKTNTKEYGRRLAKVSHSNPCIVLNIALNQIESYDNLVDVVIEASRYFTLLTFDVLIYTLLTLLSNQQKRRIKEDGTSVAHWLRSLSSFTAKIFKRYSHMDPGPICTYVAKQMKLYNAFDLIILEDLLTEMSGIRSSADLSEEQLIGCTGGPALKVEALALINDRRDPTGKVPMRLLNALDRLGLTFPLLLLISQRRADSVHNVSEDTSLLKLLANLADETQSTLIQYLDFLTINVEDTIYSQSMPSISDMVSKGIEEVVAFMLYRPVVNQKLRQQLISSADDTGSSDVADLTLPPILLDVASQCEVSYSTSTKEHLKPAFMAIFWSLSMYDLEVPVGRYEKEVSVVEQQLKALELESNTSLVRTDSAERERLGRVIADLRGDCEAQSAHTKSVYSMLRTQSRTWFSTSEREQSMSSFESSAHLFVEVCLLPRCVVSPLDASFCARFVILLHELGTPGFSLFHLYKSLFASHIPTTIFTSTEREAENLGRFYREILAFLNALVEDESRYAKIPLFDEMHKDELAWTDFKDLWYEFHRVMWSATKACFQSKEYMHIRNVLIVLERMNECFPYFKWIGSNANKETDWIIANEHREDLKIRALGYKAVLKRNQSKWKETGRQSATASPVIEKSSTPIEQRPAENSPATHVETSKAESPTPEDVAFPEPELSEQDATPTIETNESGETVLTQASKEESKEEPKEISKEEPTEISKEKSKEESKEEVPAPSRPKPRSATPRQENGRETRSRPASRAMSPITTSRPPEGQRDRALDRAERTQEPRNGHTSRGHTQRSENDRLRARDDRYDDRRVSDRGPSGSRPNFETTEGRLSDTGRPRGDFNKRELERYAPNRPSASDRLVRPDSRQADTSRSTRSRQENDDSRTLASRLSSSEVQDKAPNGPRQPNRVSSVENPPRQPQVIEPFMHPSRLAKQPVHSTGPAIPADSPVHMSRNNSIQSPRRSPPRHDSPAKRPYTSSRRSPPRDSRERQDRALDRGPNQGPDLRSAPRNPIRTDDRDRPRDRNLRDREPRDRDLRPRDEPRDRDLRPGDSRDRDRDSKRRMADELRDPRPPKRR